MAEEEVEAGTEEVKIELQEQVKGLETQHQDIAEALAEKGAVDEKQFTEIKVTGLKLG